MNLFQDDFLNLNYALDRSQKEDFLNNWIIEELKKIPTLNNCKIFKQEIISESNNFGIPITRIRVVWTCLLCNKFYENTDLMDLTTIRCLDDCQNPMRERNWSVYLANLKQVELRAKKKFARAWVGQLSDNDLMKAITALFKKELGEQLSLGEKRIKNLLLTEDKKRSRSQICQQ